MNKSQSLWNRLSAWLAKALVRLFRFLSLILDKLIFAKRFTLVGSLAITLLMYASVSMANRQASSQKFSYEKKDVPVDVIVDHQQYAVFGLPTTINVVATGSRIDIQTIESQNSVTAVIDLSGLKEGTHTVPIGTKGLSPNLSIFKSPESAQVTIEKKLSQKFNVRPEFMNQHALSPQYILSLPKLDIDEVEIKAAQSRLAEISRVVALIDVKDKQENFNTVAPIVAYNQAGEKISDVIINPSEIATTVMVSSPSRQVPILVVPVGTIANHKMIDTIELDHSTVTLFGPQEVLNKTANVKALINASALTKEDIRLKHTLVMPEGINAMSHQAIAIHLTLKDKKEETIHKVPILVENNKHNYQVRMDQTDELVLDVLLTGTENRLKNLKRSDIRLAIDIDGLAPGRHKVPVRVSGPDPLISIQSIQESVEVELSEREK